MITTLSCATCTSPRDTRVKSPNLAAPRKQAASHQPALINLGEARLGDAAKQTATKAPVSAGERKDDCLLGLPKVRRIPSKMSLDALD